MAKRQQRPARRPAVKFAELRKKMKKRKADQPLKKQTYGKGTKSR